MIEIASDIKGQLNNWVYNKNRCTKVLLGSAKERKKRKTELEEKEAQEDTYNNTNTINFNSNNNLLFNNDNNRYITFTSY
jgi:hypothetical protein